MTGLVQMAVLRAAAIACGFAIDLVVGDPHGFPHPVIWMGHLITYLRRRCTAAFRHTRAGERAAGAFLWIVVAGLSFLLPWLLLVLLQHLHPLAGFAAESIFCWQILAVRSLRVETMPVYDALQSGHIEAARRAVSMIVGRETQSLDAAGITRAAVETVAENTADGIAAPLFYLAIGGAPLGFFYKAVNTMDSMLGYTDPPYTDIGFVPAKADDICNFIPSRLCALLMLAAGAMLRLDISNGWRIFRRDRMCHASPNSAQTEAMAAGLLGIKLAGDAWYHGVLHHKPFIGDPIREIEAEDIKRVCRLSFVTSCLALPIACIIRGLAAYLTLL